MNGLYGKLVIKEKDPDTYTLSDGIRISDIPYTVLHKFLFNHGMPRTDDEIYQDYKRYWKNQLWERRYMLDLTLSDMAVLECVVSEATKRGHRDTTQLLEILDKFKKVRSVINE